ncbi:MAG: asparaginase [Acidimicrobiales bacterium]
MPQIGVVLTGGTVGSTHGPDSLIRIGDSEEQLLVDHPDLVVEQPLRKLSEDMEPSDWLLIAESVRRLAKDGVSGVTILHGTDTMSYSACALSFLLNDINIPVVFTGSMIPPGNPFSDAVTNFEDALVAARSLPSGVFVSFSGVLNHPSSVHLGTRVRKVRAAGTGFASIGANPVAKVESGTLVMNEQYAPKRQPIGPSAKKLTSRVDDRVLFLQLYPGCPLNTLADTVVKSEIKAVSIELFASLTGPCSSSTMSLPGFVAECNAHGVTVVGSTNDGVKRHTAWYESTKAFVDVGGLLLPGMLPEAATVKLMWALPLTTNRSDLEDLMMQTVADEFR